VGKFLLLVISTVIALIAVEAGMAWFNPVQYMKPPVPIPDDTWRELLHRSSSVPGLSYELVPGSEKFSKGANIKINSYGMRDDEPLHGDVNSECNVLILGDSYTFGFGVEGHETYANVLENLLTSHTSHKAVQVLNLGVGGYSSRDEALVLKYKGLEWDPELIVIGYVLNDPEIDPIQPLHRYFQESKWWQHINIFRLVAKEMNIYDINNLGGGDYIRYLHNRNGEKWGSVKIAFSDIQEIASKNDIPVILIIFPLMKGGEWENYKYGDLHSQVVNAGENSGFNTVDLTDAYSVYPQLSLMIAPGNGHPNALGHKLAADAVYKKVQEYNLLDCM